MLDKHLGIRFLDGPAAGRVTVLRRDVNPVDVVFIGGSGRSGSTLLDRMLGQVSGLHSCGEMRFVWNRGFADNRLCACDRPFLECELWGEVARRVAPDADVAPWASDIFALHQRVERQRHLPGLLFPSLRRGPFSDDLARYAEVLDRLYRAVAEVSACPAIIDSSNSPLHAMVLAAVPSVRLTVVHLVRDSRAVAFSWQRVRQRAPDPTEGMMVRYTPARAAFVWAEWNLLMHLVGRRVPAYLRVGYDRLLDNPAATIHRILSCLGRHDPLEFIHDSEVVLPVGHLVAGNPMRFSEGRIQLRRDDEWRTAMPWRSRLVVGAMTFPLLALYRPLTGRRRAAR